ncbi:MAG: protein phosphatase 2C domain-containing protein [bacterium]
MSRFLDAAVLQDCLPFTDYHCFDLFQRDRQRTVRLPVIEGHNCLPVVEHMRIKGLHMRFAYLDSSELTDTGKLRRNNEDAALRLKERGVFCVADGMGGAADGEVASRAVIDAYEEAFSGRHSDGEPDFERTKLLIREAAVNANDWIRDQAENRGAAGMGSTLVVMAFDSIESGRGIVMHAGDSRAYRLRGDTLTRLTRDHSLLSEAGIEDRESLGPMFRSMVTRAVGIRADVDLEETHVDVVENDLFLLCSDGLTTMVSDDELGRLLRENRSLDADGICRLLVNESNRRGGEDNITVLLVRVNKISEAAEHAVPEIVAPSVSAAPEAGDTPSDGEHFETVTPETADLSGGESFPGEEDEFDEVISPEEEIQPVEQEMPHHISWSDQEAELPDAEIRQVERDTTPPSDNGEGLTDSLQQHEPTSDLECVTPVSLPSGKTTEREAVQHHAGSPRQSHAVRPAPEPSARGLWIAASIFGLGVVIVVWLLVVRPVPEQLMTDSRATKTSTVAGTIPAEAIPAAPAASLTSGTAKLSDDDIANVRTALPKRLDAAMITGEWGSMSAYASKWSQSVPGLLEQSGKGPTYASWVNLWKKIHDGDIDATTACAQYRDEVTSLCRKSGFDLPPEEPGVTMTAQADLRADAACRLLYKLQKRLTDNVRNVVRNCEAAAEALGPVPPQTLAAMQSFTGEGDSSTLTTSIARAGRIANDADRLGKWLNACGDSHITLPSIKMVPSTVIPRLLQAEREQREILNRQFVMIPLRSKAHRLNAGSELISALDRIDKLYERAMSGKRASDAAAWHDTASRNVLRDLLDEIRIAMKIAGK